MFSRILAPLDGSAIAEQSLGVAKLLAARLKSQIVLFQAIKPLQDVVRIDHEVFFVDEQLDILRGQARNYLTTIRRDFERMGVQAEDQVAVGAPALAILEAVAQTRSDLVVMATHGRSGIQRWVYGSVADKVLHSCCTPILLVRAHETPHSLQAIERIFVPLDGSPLAEGALAHAEALARAFDAELTLCYVQSDTAFGELGFGAELAERLAAAKAVDIATYLNQKVGQLQATGVRSRWEIQPGPETATQILSAVQTTQADLIVMSTHGRSGVQRWVLGSVADRVLRAAPIPVLLVRSGAMASQ